MPSTCAVVLAAGKSTRMKSQLPKGLHPLCGKPVLAYVIDAARAAGAKPVVLVVGYGQAQVRSALCDTVWYAEQPEQLGTGHALLCAEASVPVEADTVLVLPGDAPLITAGVLHGLLEEHRAQGNDATVLTTVLADASHYGRVVRDGSGRVTRIVEARDATPEERAITEINAAIYAFSRAQVYDCLHHLRPENAQGEYYLTDVIAMLSGSGRRVGGVVCNDAAAVSGINHRVELAEAARELLSRRLRELMLAGVTVVDPHNTYVDAGVWIGADTTVRPGCVLEGGTRIGTGCVIGPHAHLADTQVADGARIEQSRIEKCRIGAGTRIGPFAALRGTLVEDGATVGSFTALDGGRVLSQEGGTRWVA